MTLTQTDLVLSFRKGADASDGRIVVTAGSNYGPARASGNFFLGGNQVRLTAVDLDAGGVTAQGSVALANNTPSSADLTFTARQGAFLRTGTADGRIRLTEGAGSETAILDVSGRDVRIVGQDDLVIRTFDLNGRGTLDRLPFTLAADVGGATPVKFDGNGVYARQGKGQSITLNGNGRVRENRLRNTQPRRHCPEWRRSRCPYRPGCGAVERWSRTFVRTLGVRRSMPTSPMSSWARSRPTCAVRYPARLLYRAQETICPARPMSRWPGLRSVDAPRGISVDGTVNATLTDNTLRIQANAQDGNNVRALADVTLPVETSAAPLRLAIAKTRDMSGEVSIQGQIQPIWDLFLGGERSLAGQVDARATIGGTLNAPRLNGRFDLKQGAFRDNGTGLVLGDMVLASQFDDTTAVVEDFNANDGSGGTVTGSGRIGLRVGSASSLQLRVNRFQVIDNDIATARASGPLTVTRATDGNILLAGTLNIDEAEIAANAPGSTGIVRMDVIEINKPGGDPEPTEDDAAPTSGPQISMNIDLTGREIFVRGRGLNLELALDAAVRGTIATPVLTGTANVVRGDYEFAGKRFVFDERGTVALSTDPNRIRLNLSATREDPALTATIRVTGTATSPVIALTSVPNLPQDEILSQVLFGRSASQLSGFEAAQLAAAVAGLAGGGGFDVIGNLRELAGLDRLSFGGEASGLTVAGGRYLTDDIYLEVIGGGEGGAAVNVEWQVRRNIAVSSKFGGQGDASLSIRWRRESREPGAPADRRPNR